MRRDRLFQTGKANQLAKDANELAESANGEAGAANELAENANKIALDANEVAKRSLRVGADQTVYDWTVGVEDDGRTIVLRNHCAHAADDVSVAVRSGDAAIFDAAFDHVAGFQVLRLDVSRTVNQIVEHQRKLNPAFLHGLAIRFEIDVHVAWVSELGIHRDEVINEIISCEH